MATDVEIKAGPELDCAVAEAIGERYGGPVPPVLSGKRDCCPQKCYRCGKPWTEVKQCAQDFQHCVECRDKWEVEYEASKGPPAYSTDLNAAFAAAEKVGVFSGCAGGYALEQARSQWSVSDPQTFGDAFLAQGPTPALAICAAILKLKEKDDGG